MTKQEKIKEAYGKYWEQVKNYVNKNGWCSVRRGVGFDEIISNLSWETRTGNQYCWRPKSLQGIENNNNWIKLDAKSDLPKETGQYLTRRANGIIITEWFYNNNLSWYLWKDCYSITHYQLIIKPREPLY